MFAREDVSQLVRAFSLVEGEEEIKAFLTICARPARCATWRSGSRSRVASTRAAPILRFRAQTGASSTTVSRVWEALNGEYGGYRRVIVRLEDAE